MKKAFAIFLVGLGCAYAQAQDSSNWTDKISLKGDFRFRTEMIDREESGAAEDYNQLRNRLRLRLSVIGEVNAETKIVARIATGSTSADDATSTNQTLDNYEAKKAVVLDLAYFDWKAMEEFKLLGGKMPTPFHQTGASDLYFDSDLTPEGLALQYKGATENLEYMVNLAGIWLDERASTTETNTDVGLLGAQAALRYSADQWHLLLGVAQYTYANIEGKTAAVAKGNTVVGGAYANDFNVLVYSLEAGGKIGELPVILYAETIENTEADQEEAGVIYGLKIGKLKEKGDWALAADYRELEADATVGALSESDLSGGGADITGTRLGAQYQVSEGVGLSLTHMIGELDVVAGGRDYTRSQLDLSFGF